VICPTSDFQKTCQVRWRKIFRFFGSANQLYGLAIPRSQGGRFAIVTKRGAGCDERPGRADERGAEADGEVVWSWSPDAGIKSCEVAMSARHAAQGDGGYQARHSGESTK